MFKDDLKESLLPRLPASKRDPHGPFQGWQELADQMFKVRNLCSLKWDPSIYDLQLKAGMCCTTDMKSPLTPSQLILVQEIIEDPTKEEKFVDWRGLLIALVDAKFSHIIASASCEDILTVRKGKKHTLISIIHLQWNNSHCAFENYRQV